MGFTEEEQSQLQKIKAIFIDVDGVLTDGKIILGDHPSIYVSNPFELKAFHVRDGMAIKIAQRCGLKIGFITGRSSHVVMARAQELHIDYLFQGVIDKYNKIKEICRNEGWGLEEVCYIGDDLPDIPALAAVGVAATVNDAPEEVKTNVHYISEKNGGCGAVWDIIKNILVGQHKWYQTIDELYRSRL